MNYYLSTAGRTIDATTLLCHDIYTGITEEYENGMVRVMSDTEITEMAKTSYLRMLECEVEIDRYLVWQARYLDYFVRSAIKGSVNDCSQRIGQIRLPDVKEPDPFTCLYEKPALLDVVTRNAAYGSLLVFPAEDQIIDDGRARIEGVPRYHHARALFLRDHALVAELDEDASRRDPTGEGFIGYAGDFAVMSATQYAPWEKLFYPNINMFSALVEGEPPMPVGSRLATRKSIAEAAADKIGDIVRKGDFDAWWSSFSEAEKKVFNASKTFKTKVS